MRSLIIGANGFVGRHLVAHLIEMGDEVSVTTTTGRFPEFSVPCYRLDVTEYAAAESVIRETQPEWVYHVAGIAFVPEAEASFERTLNVNVAGPSNVIRNCHLLGRDITFLLVSSAEVYGHIAQADLPISEATELRPASNYSLSKRMAELVVERYARQGRVRTIIARPFNHVGPGQDPRFVVSSFAQQLARIAHGKASSTLLVGNLENRRDFSDVRDIVRGYRLLAAGGQGIYNLGSGAARPVSEILAALIAVSGLSVTVKQDAQRMRPSEVPELYGSIAKIHSQVGWAPTIPIHQTLEDVYRDWYDKIAKE